MNVQAEFVEDILLMELMVHKFSITGIDNTALAQEVLINQDIRRKDDPNSIMNEDSLLVLSPESQALKLVTVVNNLVASKKLITTEQWGLIHRPLESTNTHRHGDRPLSWVYYVKIPKKAGDLVFSFFDKFTSSLAPEEGTLLMFPGWMQHSVSKNKSDEIRISIAGNCAYFDKPL